MGWAVWAALGLNEANCHAIWQFSALRQKSPWHSLRLGFKLKRVPWVLAYLKEWVKLRLRRVR